MPFDLDRLRRLPAARYTPLVAIGLAVLLLAFAVPQGDRDDAVDESALQVGGGDGSTTVPGETATTVATTDTTVAGTAGTTGKGGTGTTAARPGTTSGTTGGTGTGSTGTTGGTGTVPVKSGVGPGSPVKGGTCRADGRMPIGNWSYSPPCVAPFSGDNGGRTHRGVSKGEIKVVLYQAKDFVSQFTGQTGENTGDDDWERTMRAYEKWFNARYETYGRKVVFERFKSEATPTDDQQVRADAVRVAEEKGAFASVSAPGSYAYCDELAARGVLCLSPIGGPTHEFVRDHGPYFWGLLMNSGQAIDLRSEHICKKLGSGRKAVWAGSQTPGEPDYRTLPRKIGIVHIDYPNGQFKATGQYHKRKLAECGVNANLYFYTYDASNLGTLGTQANSIVTKLKDDDVTTVLINGDHVFPIFATNEARNQLYNPEWLVNGTGLIDLDASGRLYDQDQWSHAFGVSSLGVLADMAKLDPYKAYKSVEPNTEPANVAGPMFSLMTMFFTGIHLAGPALNPVTFRDGMYSYPPSGGTPTRPLVNFAPNDHTAISDMHEVYWDRGARGFDGNTGAYRHMDSGKRYTFGAWPSGDSPYFNTNGTVVHFGPNPPDGENL